MWNRMSHIEEVAEIQIVSLFLVSFGYEIIKIANHYTDISALSKIQKFKFRSSILYLPNFTERVEKYPEKTTSQDPSPISHSSLQR